MTELIVNLDQPPAKRWQILAPYREQGRTLITGMLEGALDNNPGYGRALRAYAYRLPRWFRAEAKSIAAIFGLKVEAVIAGNLYYDLLKLIFQGSPFGCTTVSLADANGVPLHARNLDWADSTGVNLLSSATMVFDFQRGGQTVFKSVGWPGYFLVLSGMAPGRFSVTLNAILSEDKTQLTYLPVTVLLRRLLEGNFTYAEALKRLQTTKLMSDSLLMLVGTNGDERIVIERTPTRAALRRGKPGQPLVVTNDYLALEAHDELEGGIADTSCDRFDAATAHSGGTSTPDDLLRVLSRSDIKWSLTVQQMVFAAAQGICVARPA